MYGTCLFACGRCPNMVNLCRDELQAKLETLDHKLSTARLDQESAKTCCTDLEERLSAEQFIIKQLQDRYDQQLLQRCLTSCSTPF